MRVRNDGEYIYVYDTPYSVEEAVRLAGLIHSNAMECKRNNVDLEAAEANLTERRSRLGGSEECQMSSTNAVHARTGPDFDISRVAKLPGWRPLTKEERMGRDLYPNVIHQNRSDRKVVIMLRQSDTEGLSLGTTVVDYYMKRLDDGIVTRVFVGAWDKDGDFIDWIDLRVLARRLRGQEPNRSNTPGWPSYWWLKDDFTISSKEDFRGVSDML
jgi:hypothetical protein